MKIADNYKKDIPLVLYGAGVTAGYVYESFVEHGIKAVCFADGDKNKQGKPPYRGSDLITHSIDEVKTLYPQFQIYVTVFSTVKYSIFDFLVNKANINKKDILNYEQYIKRYSCKHLENHFRCTHENVRYCCDPRDKVKVPVIYYNDSIIYEKDELNNSKIIEGESQIRALNKLFKLREETIKGLQNNTAKFCVGCSFLDKMYVPENIFRINNYVFGSCIKSICNLKCFYCPLHCNPNEKNTPTIPEYPFVFTKYLEEKGLIAPEFTTIFFADGELTVLPNRKELFSIISRYNSQIFTNAVVYSEETADLLSVHKTRILVSVDAGTEETFYKIKGKNLFSEVRNTLIKYGKTNGNIVLKYIFLPGVNDNKEDLKGFLKLCKDVNIEQVRLSLDYIAYNNDDYLRFKNDGLFSKIINYSDELRQHGFLVDAVEMSAFMKSEYDAICNKRGEQ